MSKKSFLAAVTLCASVLGVAAQEVTMGVPELLVRIASDNREVRSARSGLEAAEQAVSVARSARLPQVNASLDLNYIGDGTIIDRNFSNAMRDKLPHFGNTLNVNLYQPVFHGGAITAGIDLARLQTELAAIGVSQATDAMGIEALGCFFNLLKMQNLRNVYVENIGITQQLIEHMKERFQQGMALQNDVTRYELRLSSLRYDLQCIDNSISVLNTNLISLLGMDESTVIRPAADYAADIMTEDYWQELTSARSNELRSIDKSMEMAKTEFRLERAAKLPSVGIVVVDNLSGPVTFEIPAIDKNYNAWFAGVSLKYNLSSLWTANKKMKKKKLELTHLEDQREAVGSALYRKVHEAYVASVQARQMLDTETVNVRLASENYSVVETRFQNDMALLTDMLDASTAKLDAETRLVNARINMLLSYYQLKFLSGSLTTL